MSSLTAPPDHQTLARVLSAPGRWKPLLKRLGLVAQGWGRLYAFVPAPGTRDLRFGPAHCIFLGELGGAERG